jgi:hypothetical protein
MQDRLSQRANKTFLIASVLTFVSFGAVVALTIIDLSTGLPSVTFGPSIAAIVGFCLIFVGAAVCVIAQLVLWLGMILITVVGNEPLPFKVPLVLFQLVFMSIGSAIVYLTFYRPRTKHVARLKVSDI